MDFYYVSCKKFCTPVDLEVKNRAPHNLEKILLDFA